MSPPLGASAGGGPPPSHPLRVLVVEDSPVDLELLIHELEKAGFRLEIDVVATRDEYAARLASGTAYDLVLSDFRLPGWSGIDALDLLRAADRELPFVLVTGSLGDEGAVECIKRGATDYVLKENLARLPVSVRRALDERRLRAEHLRQETEKEQLRQQLLHSQKMEAVGRLAGGIAHDFNNLLTAILGYSELLAVDLGEGHESRPHVDEIRRAAERASSLTGQLLAFSRRQTLELRPVDLNSVVTEMERMLRRLLGEQIELETRLDPELGPVRADAGQLEQVVLNLAINAMDAMPGGGTLTLETGRREVATGGAEPVPAGAYAVLVVADTGEGMDPEVLDRIFEPFFTTKEPGHGTGLGLSTVYGIVTQSDGHVVVESRPGEGSRFSVFLPRIAAAAAGATASPDPAPKSQ